MVEAGMGIGAGRDCDARELKKESAAPIGEFRNERLTGMPLYHEGVRAGLDTTPQTILADYLHSAAPARLQILRSPLAEY